MRLSTLLVWPLMLTGAEMHMYLQSSNIVRRGYQLRVCARYRALHWPSGPATCYEHQYKGAALPPKERFRISCEEIKGAFDSLMSAKGVKALSSAAHMVTTQPVLILFEPFLCCHFPDLLHTAHRSPANSSYFLSASPHVTCFTFVGVG